MKVYNKFIVKLSLVSLILIFGACSENGSSEMTKGHRQAIKEQCKNDPDKKLCGKEVRIKFKKDGHQYVNFKDLSKAEKNRVILNCGPEKKYGLIPYNECLYNNKQLALGNNLTPKDNKRITSNIDEIKQYVWRVMAFNENEEGGASGTGVAIAKNYIVTNCHVVLNDGLTEKRNKPQYYDVILVENLHDENMGGSVQLFKKGYNNDLDICILKTKTDLNYVKTKVKYKKLKQRMKVLAMGNPKGIIGHTSDGKITALETWKTDIVHPLVNKNSVELKYPWKIIHHDAAIGQGSSGGPLFDAGGNLIGINTLAQTEGTTGSFAIALSADHINDVLRD